MLFFVLSNGAALLGVSHYYHCSKTTTNNSL